MPDPSITPIGSVKEGPLASAINRIAISAPREAAALQVTGQVQGDLGYAVLEMPPRTGREPTCVVILKQDPASGTDAFVLSSIGLVGRTCVDSGAAAWAVLNHLDNLTAPPATQDTVRVDGALTMSASQPIELEPVEFERKVYDQVLSAVAPLRSSGARLRNFIIPYQRTDLSPRDLASGLLMKTSPYVVGIFSFVAAAELALGSASGAILPLVGLGLTFFLNDSYSANERHALLNWVADKFGHGKK